MCAPSMPEPPDPYETAAAQTGTNINTAIANNKMGLVDQITPYGSLTYEAIYDSPNAAPVAPSAAPAAPTGYDIPSWAANTPGFEATPGNPQFDALLAQGAITPQGGAAPQGGAPSLTGGLDIASQVPRYQATVSLSPEQQRILDASQGARGSLAELAQERSEFLKDYLPNASPAGVAKAVEGYITPRLDERFGQEEEAIRTRLAQQGLTSGTEAWNREMERLGRSKNDAYNTAMVDSYGMGMQAVNNPINQITALLSQGQVTGPNVRMSQPASMPTVDQAGLINSNYNQRAQVAASQPSFLDTFGGLFGLATAPVNPTSLLGGFM